MLLIIRNHLYINGADTKYCEILILSSYTVGLCSASLNNNHVCVCVREQIGEEAKHDDINLLQWRALMNIKLTIFALIKS